MNKHDYITDHYPRMVNRVGNHFEGLLRGVPTNIFTKVSDGSRLQMRFRNGTGMQGYLETDERVFTTNCPDQIMASEEKCFVPFSDYNKLKQAYLGLLMKVDSDAP